MNICVCITGIETFAITYILIMFSGELYYQGESFAFINWCCVQLCCGPNYTIFACLCLNTNTDNLSDAGDARRFLFSIIYVCKSIVFFMFQVLVVYQAINILIWKQGYFRNKAIRVSQPIRTRVQ